MNVCSGTRLYHRDGGGMEADLWIYERTNIGAFKVCLGCCTPCILGADTMGAANGSNRFLCCIAYTLAMPIVGPCNRRKLRKLYRMPLLWKEDDCIFPTFKCTCLNCCRTTCLCDCCVYTCGCCCCAIIQEATYVRNEEVVQGDDYDGVAQQQANQSDSKME